MCDSEDLNDATYDQLDDGLDTYLDRSSFFSAQDRQHGEKQTRIDYEQSTSVRWRSMILKNGQKAQAAAEGKFQLQMALFDHEQTQAAQQVQRAYNQQIDGPSVQRSRC